MKTKLEIISAETTGDALKLTAQGRVGRAQWKPIVSMTLLVDDTEANRRAFHVGRMVSFSVSPR